MKRKFAAYQGINLMIQKETNVFYTIFTEQRKSNRVIIKAAKRNLLKLRSTSQKLVLYFDILWLNKGYRISHCEYSRTNACQCKISGYEVTTLGTTPPRFADRHRSHTEYNGKDRAKIVNIMKTKIVSVVKI